MPEQKEQEPVGSAVEKQPVLQREGEVKKEGAERAPEVESVVEKIERQRKKKGDKQDDVSTVVPASDNQPAVTLPVTQGDVARGKKMPIVNSLRWLVEWATRQIKKFKGRVKYQENKDMEKK